MQVATVADLNSENPSPSRVLEEWDSREGLLILQNDRPIPASRGYRVLLIGKEALADIDSVTDTITFDLKQRAFKVQKDYFWQYLPAGEIIQLLEQWSSTIVSYVQELWEKTDDLRVLDRALQKAILCLPQEGAEQEHQDTWILRGVLAGKTRGKQGVVDIARRYQLGVPHFSIQKFENLVLERGG